MSSIKRWTILILGATGDLARRKLLPALYYLSKHHKELDIRFFGAAKDDTSAQQLLDDVAQELPSVDQELFQRLRQQSMYQQLSFESAEDFVQLANQLQTFEGNQPTHRLVYLAAPADFFCTLTQNLATSGIINKQAAHAEPVRRVVYEKPFGYDATSALEINTCITKLLDESQIYRIDHYLTKALVQSIRILREGNIFFHHIWSQQYIQQVQIELLEALSVKTRGSFYDRYGALKDVVQNHMLQMLALIALKEVGNPTLETVSEAKTAILSKTIPVDGILGQYQGYQTTPGVTANSQTETFALLKCSIQAPQWQSVPFYLKTGKMLLKQKTALTIIFKPLPFGKHKVEYQPNVLTISVDPHAGFTLSLNVQKATGIIEPILMDFCYTCSFGYDQPQPYELLLHDVMTARRDICISFSEILAAWKIIETIENQNYPLYLYEPHSAGPAETNNFLKKYHATWFESVTNQ